MKISAALVDFPVGRYYKDRISITLVDITR